MKTNTFCSLFYSQEWPEHEVATCPQCHAAWQALDSEPQATDKGIYLGPLVRPPHIPDTGGCPPDCGHTEQEHIAFDIGVHDGEHEVTVPPVECCDDSEGSRTLREAWMTGWEIGRSNRV